MKLTMRRNRLLPSAERCFPVNPSSRFRRRGLRAYQYCGTGGYRPVVLRNLNPSAAPDTSADRVTRTDGGKIAGAGSVTISADHQHPRRGAVGGLSARAGVNTPWSQPRACAWGPDCLRPRPAGDVTDSPRTIPREVLYSVTVDA